MPAETPESEAKEIELKLAFEPEFADSILAHPFFADGETPLEGAAPRVLEGKERELISIYYDTPDDTLRKAGVFLRVRLAGSGYIQTIKTARAESEFLERKEWECSLPTSDYDLSAAKGTALEPLLSGKVKNKLGPRFETRFHRHTFLLEQDGTKVEAAVDRGEIVAGAARSRVCELELELKSGDSAVLFSLAKQLAETLPLVLSIKTKAERGFELLDGGEPDFEKALPVTIGAKATCADAFRIAARNCLRQVLVNVPGTRAGRPESIHQMRVGLRRLRAAITLFGDVLLDSKRQHITGELKWIGSQLGPARDLDVFISDIVRPHQDQFPDDPGWQAVGLKVRDARDEAQKLAVAAAQSARFRLALLDLGAWVEHGEWSHRQNDLAHEPVKAYAVSKLAQLRRSIVKKGKNLAALSVSERHRLRIRGKRMRYGSEFFSATFPGKESAKRSRKALAALEKLQDSLGTLNDIANRQTIFDFEHHELGPVTLPMPKVDPSEEKALMKTAKRAYSRFADIKPFWKK